MGAIVVVGGALPGIAAAARLAKAGHRVVLLERRDRLGGRWAAPGVLPPVFVLPAPWRDLFKKSGRAYEPELTRSGLALVPAPSAEHVFPDGTTFAWPTDRGAQWRLLADRYDAGVATHWRDTLDDFDEVWQALRHLGLEAELADAAQVQARRRLLHPRFSVEDLARHLGHPHLSHLIRDVAYRMGSAPRHTPGWNAVRLNLERTFDRWVLTAADHPVPAARMLDVLVGRLATRGVDVRTGVAVDAIEAGRVLTAEGPVPADAVVSAVDPWEHARLSGRLEPDAHRRARWTTPAHAPRVTVEVVAGSLPAGEVVRHTETGPVVTYRRPVPGGTELTTHDFTEATPDPGYGTRWQGPRTWLRLAPVRTSAPTLVLASSSARGGADPWAQLLTGALATYAVHEILTGEDLRPTNRGLRTDERI